MSSKTVYLTMSILSNILFLIACGACKSAPEGLGGLECLVPFMILSLLACIFSLVSITASIVYLTTQKNNKGKLYLTLFLGMIPLVILAWAVFCNSPKQS